MRRQKKLDRRLGQLLRGGESGNLEELLMGHLARVEQAVEQSGAVHEELKTLRVASQSAIRHVGLVRFNPFSDTGGDLSFALAVADSQGNGFVLSSLHGRGETRVYAKPLQGWSSSYTLSEEELEAVSKARASETN